MAYTLETKIQFAVSVGRTGEESISTMEELGFTQDELDSRSTNAIEKDLQEMYKDWETNYLDSGWAVVEE